VQFLAGNEFTRIKERDVCTVKRYGHPVEAKILHYSWAIRKAFFYMEKRRELWEAF